MFGKTLNYIGNGIGMIRNRLKILNVVILVVGLTAKPDTTIETWAHKKTVECIEQKEKQQRILDIAGM